MKGRSFYFGIAAVENEGTKDSTWMLSLGCFQTGTSILPAGKWGWWAVSLAIPELQKVTGHQSSEAMWLTLIEVLLDWERIFYSLPRSKFYRTIITSKDSTRPGTRDDHKSKFAQMWTECIKVRGVGRQERRWMGLKPSFESLTLQPRVSFEWEKCFPA